MPRGGKRPGAGRPEGSRNSLSPKGAVKAVLAAGLRIPPTTSPEHKELADYCAGRIVDVMAERVEAWKAFPVLAAATRLREEICGPLPKRTELSGPNGEPVTIEVVAYRDGNGQVATAREILLLPEATGQAPVAASEKSNEAPPDSQAERDGPGSTQETRSGPEPQPEAPRAPERGYGGNGYARHAVVEMAIRHRLDAPLCSCGHQAKAHREFFLESDCALCGKPAEEHIGRSCPYEPDGPRGCTFAAMTLSLGVSGKCACSLYRQEGR